jgi:4-hydroxy-tetrahydrodipicolinate synthase
MEPTTHDTATGDLVEQQSRLPAIRGVLSAILTPFTSDGRKVAESPLRALVDRTLDAGADGLVVCGGTGEFFALSPDERRRIVEIVCAEVDGRVPVIAQTGAMATTEAIEHSRHAEQVGASALMLAPPYYEPLGEDQARNYFAAVATSVELPVVLYNYPHGTRFAMTAEFITKIAADFDSIRYVKDSSADVVLLSELVTKHADVVGTFCGEDVLVGPALLLGAHGTITGSVNFMMPVHVQMMRAAAANDVETVVQLWRETLPLVTFLATHPYTDAVKAACRLLGHDLGPVRAPLPTLSRDDLRALEIHIRQLDWTYFA